MRREDTQAFVVTVSGGTTYTLTISTSGNGTTSPSAGTHTYNSGDRGQRDGDSRQRSHFLRLERRRDRHRQSGFHYDERQQDPDGDLHWRLVAHTRWPLYLR